MDGDGDRDGDDGDGDDMACSCHVGGSISGMCLEVWGGRGASGQPHLVLELEPCQPILRVECAGLRLRPYNQGLASTIGHARRHISARPEPIRLLRATQNMH